MLLFFECLKSKFACTHAVLHANESCGFSSDVGSWALNC